MENTSELIEENENCSYVESKEDQDRVSNIYDLTFGLFTNILSTGTKDEQDRIIVIIKKIIKNILDHPEDDNYHKIKFTNKNIQLIFQIHDSYSFFVFLGFKEMLIDDELYFVIVYIEQEKLKLVYSYLSLLDIDSSDNNVIIDNQYQDNPEINNINESKPIIDVLKYTKENRNYPKNKNKDIKEILKETAQFRKINYYNNANPSDNKSFNQSFKEEEKVVNNVSNRFVTMRDLKFSNPDIDKLNTRNFVIKEEIGRKCLQLTNEFRKRNGKTELEWDDHIWKICYEHSYNMGIGKVKFGHDGFNIRIKKLPFYYSAAFENVYMCQGYSEYVLAEMAVNGWINSPGHRKNLLSYSSHCAIAVFRNNYSEFYLTQIFVKK